MMRSYTTTMQVPFEDFNATTNATIPVTGTEGSHSGNLTLIIVVVAVMIVVVMIVIYYIYERKRRLDLLRHHLMPMYTFEPNGEDWEAELLEGAEPNPRFGYRSMEFATSESTDLFRR